MNKRYLRHLNRSKDSLVQSNISEILTYSMDNVAVPVIASKGNIACDGQWSPIGVVLSRNGSSVEASKPNHHFVDISTARRSGCEKIVCDICNFSIRRT
jgi:hypothetical protein